MSFVKCQTSYLYVYITMKRNNSMFSSLLTARRDSVFSYFIQISYCAKPSSIKKKEKRSTKSRTVILTLLNICRLPNAMEPFRKKTSYTCTAFEPEIAITVIPTAREDTVKVSPYYWINVNLFDSAPLILPRLTA